jgi:hypothetical protein
MVWEWSEDDPLSSFIFSLSSVSAQRIMVIVLPCHDFLSGYFFRPVRFPKPKQVFIFTSTARAA